MSRDDEQRAVGRRGEPLGELADLLERDGEVPLAWIVAFAPDGEVDARIAGHWALCRDARIMARLARLAAPDGELVRAAAACACLALDSIPVSDARPWTALTTLEQWLAGAASNEALDAARAAVDEFGRTVPSRRERQAVFAVLTAIATAGNRLGIVATVRSALEGLGTTQAWGAARLARVIKAVVRPPTFAQLIAATRAP